jgi:hypothetical protein
VNAAALALSVNDLALGFSVLLGFSPSDPGFFSSSLVLGGGGELGLGGGATFPVMAVTPGARAAPRGSLGNSLGAVGPARRGAGAHDGAVSVLLVVIGGDP